MCAGIDYKHQVESNEFTGIECCNQDVAVQLPNYPQREEHISDKSSIYILKFMSFHECPCFAPSRSLFNFNS